MIHIEKFSGKTYPIVEMSEEHLIKVIEYYLNAMEKISFDANIRYINEFESYISKLMPYVFVALGKGIFNPFYIDKIEKLYVRYDKKRRSSTFELMPEVWHSDLVD